MQNFQNDGDMGWKKFYTSGVLVKGVYVMKIINKNYFMIPCKIIKNIILFAYSCTYFIQIFTLV